MFHLPKDLITKHMNSNVTVTEDDTWHLFSLFQTISIKSSNSTEYPVYLPTLLNQQTETLTLENMLKIPY